MKKLLFFVSVASITLISCAKDRSCTCTDSATNSTTTNTYKRTIVESTKGQAKANCVSTSVTYTNNVTYTTDCKLD
jgi:hypothetical protein